MNLPFITVSVVSFNKDLPLTVRCIQPLPIVMLLDHLVPGVRMKTIQMSMDFASTHKLKLAVVNMQMIAIIQLLVTCHHKFVLYLTMDVNMLEILFVASLQTHLVLAFIMLFAVPQAHNPAVPITSMVLVVVKELFVVDKMLPH